MTYSGKIGTLRTLAFAAAVALPTMAFAQEATAPAASDTPWVKVCGQNETCNISQVLVAQNGSLIASFSIEQTADKKLAVGAFVPLGFVIPAGVQLAVDGEAKGAAQFFICVPPSTDGPAGCAARAEVNEDFINALKRGNKLAIVLANTAGQPIPIEMTLIGFSKTFDGEGLDPVAARAMEVEQSKQLQEDARAAFQRMIERQRAESGTN